MLGPRNEVLVETGDAWFQGWKLRLPDGCGCAYSVSVESDFSRARLP